jgi:PST family polysaccharide transporter
MMFKLSAENQRFFSNTFFLAIMQAANSFLPLLTVPFLVRVLGVELFGQLAFAMALMFYFIVLADYGFNLTATRAISIHREDRAKVGRIYSSVMLIKFFLLLFSAFCLLVLMFFVPALSEYRALYFASFLVVIGQSLFPVWFFQGMEKMKYVTYLSVLAKVFLTAGIFIFVSGPDDYLYVPLLTAMGFLLSVVLALYLIHGPYCVRFTWSTWQEIRTNLAEGWYVFLSQLKVTLFSSTNIVILGILSGPVAVGYYVGAEKIMRALALAQTPITGALFPLIAKKMTYDQAGAMVKLKKITYLGSVLYLVVLLWVYVLSDTIIQFLYTDEMQSSTWVLKVMLVIPLLIFLNNIFGTQILLNTGREKTFFYVLLCAALLSLLLCISLTQLYSYQGTTIALLITEIFIVVVFFLLIRKDWLRV